MGLRNLIAQVGAERRRRGTDQRFVVTLFDIDPGECPPPQNGGSFVVRSAIEMLLNNDPEVATWSASARAVAEHGLRDWQARQKALGLQNATERDKRYGTGT
jgi:hypothetical protein